MEFESLCKYLAKEGHFDQFWKAIKKKQEEDTYTNINYNEILKHGAALFTSRVPKPKGRGGEGEGEGERKEELKGDDREAETKYEEKDKEKQGEAIGDQVKEIVKIVDMGCGLILGTHCTSTTAQTVNTNSNTNTNTTTKRTMFLEGEFYLNRSADKL